jgi:xylulokinase
MRENFEASGEANVWKALMDEAAARPVGSHGCIMLPHWSGANAPRVNATSLGAFVGMNNNVTRSDMIRAVVEGLCYMSREIFEAMEEATGYKTPVLKVAGGATQNTFWMQTKADVLGKPIEILDMYETTALGCALLAGVGAGIYKNDAEAIAAAYRPGIIYEPHRERHVRYSELFYDVYLNIQDGLQDVNQRIFSKFMA